MSLASHLRAAARTALDLFYTSQEQAARVEVSAKFLGAFANAIGDSELGAVKFEIGSDDMFGEVDGVLEAARWCEEASGMLEGAAEKVDGLETDARNLAEYTAELISGLEEQFGLGPPDHEAQRACERILKMLPAGVNPASETE